MGAVVQRGVTVERCIDRLINPVRGFWVSSPDATKQQEDFPTLTGEFYYIDRHHQDRHK
jgi:hypothetical protein